MQVIVDFWKTAKGKLIIISSGGLVGLISLCLVCTVCGMLGGNKDDTKQLPVNPTKSKVVSAATIEPNLISKPSDTPLPIVDTPEAELIPTLVLPTKTLTPTKSYHPDNRINYLIIGFNKLSPEKITDVPQDFSYQVFLGIGNVWVRIASNNAQTFVDISDEVPAGELDEIFKYGDYFTRVAQPSVTDDQLVLATLLIRQGNEAFRCEIRQTGGSF